MIYLTTALEANMIMEWWQVLGMIAGFIGCAMAGYFQGTEVGYEQGYNQALADMKGNNEDFDHIIGGG